MNKLTHLCLVLLLACLPTWLLAQETKNYIDNNSRYLVGAVPEVEGKVIFSKEFNIPGMSQQQVFDRMQKWLTNRLKANKNIGSRIVYSDAKKGLIAGVGEEWLVFKSTALSLDRTLLNYQVTISCQAANCFIKLEKIRFTYRETEKYTAEEWITDQYALNKTQTKLVRGLAKWRQKSVDFSEELFEQAAQALSAVESKRPEVEESKKKREIITGPILIKTQKVVTEVQPVATTPSINTPTNTSSSMPGYKEIAPDQIPANAIQMGAGKLVIAIGNDAFNMTMMTANAGGSLGKISGKPVVFSILSPDQTYQQLEQAESYSVRFYPTNQNEPSVVLSCKRIVTSKPMNGQPRTYVGEIVQAWVK